MQVRAFRLPPLPNRKNAPLQIENVPSPQGPVTHRMGSFSREKPKRNILEEREKSIKNLKRPSSVRSYSRESIQSRDSRDSRGSSRQGSVQLAKDKINHNAKIRISMPSVSAKSWAVYEMKQAKFIYGKRTFKKREMASLTKIMNFITILELVKEYKLEAGKIKVRVSKEASCLHGTTAEIKAGMEISLYDLYFGMMLPSGNDAAFQIAQIGGSLLILDKISEEARDNIIYSVDKLTQFYQARPQSVKLYLAHMNRISKKLGMQNSHFANPHGLSNPDNYSSAQDLCRLCTVSMENEMFRYVVATQNYHMKYMEQRAQQQEVLEMYENDSMEYNIQWKNKEKEKQESQVQEKVLRWENTNKMLKQGWSGIKTGITPNAGPCLAASVTKFLNGRSFSFLVILICSKSMDARWKEVKEIVDWVVEQKLYV